jgi:hypothetical protein
VSTSSRRGLIRTIVAVSLLALSSIFFAGAARASTFYGPTEAWIAGGAAFTSGGDFAVTWNDGFVVAAGVRRRVAPNVTGGIQLGYFRHPASDAPGSESDAGIFAVTTETDVFLNREQGGGVSTLRPFINAGLGYYYVFVEDVQSNLLAPGSIQPEEFETHAFGVHGGGGIEIGKGSIGFRLDAAYHLIFRGGDDIGDIPVRACILFR